MSDLYKRLLEEKKLERLMGWVKWEVSTSHTGDRIRTPKSTALRPHDAELILLSAGRMSDGE